MNLVNTKYNLLIVEDDQDMREVVCEQFQDMGYNVICAENGKEALYIIENQIVDMILSDIQMPKMNGIELLKSVRSRHPQKPKLLFITGQSPLDEKAAKELGASGLFYKPFDFDAVAAEVDRLISVV
ncbi:MAG: response regulator [Bdellovibrionales bacterium]|nr:response regulator [Bdellovibrionales bacterium]